MNPNTQYERFAQHICMKLLNYTLLKPIAVSHNVKLQGKSGCKHQIDVYWEYEHEGKLHRVAIECKNYNSMVPIGKVRDFWGVINDLDNVSGIMISRIGFQSGAIQYGNYYGIALKTLDVPTGEEQIGSISFSCYSEVRHCLFMIDKEWALQNGFNIQQLRERLSLWQPSKSEYWMETDHFPMKTLNDCIKNKNGGTIATINQLEKRISDEQLSAGYAVFPFDDAWIISEYWGPVKINEVKFEWERSIQETEYSLLAEGFVEAILKDALNDDLIYVSKY